jgi:type I restriction enzyme M protein
MPLSKQQLGSLLWGMADTGLRGKVEDYKAYILSLLFFKRLSDNYEWETEKRTEQFRQQYGKEPNARQLARLQEEGHAFTIPPECFWADVRNAALDDKNERLHEAVNGIAERNPALRGIINSVRWNEPAPDGSGKKRLDPEVVAAAINYLDPIPLDNSNVTPDVLGDAYEYLIKKFADENKAGATAGQFYTPPEVRDIIIRFIQPQPDQTMYDPTCGSGGFLIDGAKFVRASCGDVKRLRLFGQETIWNTWAIANINMLLHALDGKIEQGNTIKAPKFLGADGPQIRQFDRVGANFPFSEENWWLNGTPKKDAKGKPVLKKNGSPQLEYPDKDEFSDPYERFTYGIPPFSNGDFAFLQHVVASLNDGGRAGVVCPQGVLFRGQPAKTEEEDGQNRKADDEYLIRRGFLTGARDKDGNLVGEDTRNLIEAIVVLPDNLFYGTTIPGAIVFFNKNKPKDRADKVLMVYAAREGWYKETPDQNILLPHDVLRILIQLLAWGDIEVARRILPEQKTRLYANIQERLEFETFEINLRYRDEVLERGTVLEKLADKALNNGERSKLERRLARLDEEMEQMKQDLAEAEKRAQQERESVDRVESELLEMFANPDLRKRYHAIVDLAEIEENEYNLNIPRYVDTFAPEDRIEIVDVLRELREVQSAELAADHALGELLKGIAPDA